MIQYISDKIVCSSGDTFITGILDGADLYTYDTTPINHYLKVTGIWKQVGSSSTGTGCCTGSSTTIINTMSGVTGISVTGSNSMTGLINFSGINGINVIKSGDNNVLISGTNQNFSTINNGITGIGISGYIPKFVNSSGLNNSSLYYNSSDNLIFPSGGIMVGSTTNPIANFEVNGSFALTRNSINMTSGSTNILGYSASNAILNSNSTDPNSVIFRISALSQGIIKVLEWGTGFGKIPNLTGSAPSMKLNGDWVPGAGDTLSIIYNGTDWLELCRKIYSGVNTSTQNIINGITGSGTINYLPLWVSSSGLSNSNIYQSGVSMGIGRTNPNQNYTLDVITNLVISNDSNATTKLDIKNPNGLGTVSLNAGGQMVYNHGSLHIFSINGNQKLQLNATNFQPLAETIDLGAVTAPNRWGDGHFKGGINLYSGGKTISYQEDFINSKLGTGKLVSGGLIVSNNNVAISRSRIFVSNASGEGTLGILSSFISGSSIVIYSTSNTDTSLINWFILEALNK